jgi:hypothetical protein
LDAVMLASKHEKMIVYSPPRGPGGDDERCDMANQETTITAVEEAVRTFKVISKLEEMFDTMGTGRQGFQVAEQRLVDLKKTLPIHVKELSQEEFQEYMCMTEEFRLGKKGDEVVTTEPEGQSEMIERRNRLVERRKKFAQVNAERIQAGHERMTWQAFVEQENYFARMQRIASGWGS